MHEKGALIDHIENLVKRILLLVLLINILKNDLFCLVYLLLLLLYQIYIAPLSYVHTF